MIRFSVNDEMSGSNPNSTMEPSRSQRSRSSRVNYKRLSGEEDPDEQIPTSSLGSEEGSLAYENKSTDRIGYYGNKHVQLIINNDFDDPSSILQTVSDGTKLTAEALYEGIHFNINNPLLITDTPESLGMTMPKRLTVRDIAQCIGFSFPINVMDVSTQEELPDWTLKDLVMYFECPIRKQKLAEYNAIINNNKNGQAQMDVKNLPKILNQISLEFSRTPLIRRVRSPTFVRDIDWIDNAWPQSRKNLNQYPQVQYYCLTSTAGCYTDFHTDFGGTSVWYHVISGEKIFLLIPPLDDNLKVYEEWICNPNQGNIFFANLVQTCYKVGLEAGKTLIIPTGWIHAVYTPVDSVVIGGNFLHSLDIKGQLNIHCIETRTHVPQKFRFPYFRQINFYAASALLQKVRKGKLSELERKTLPALVEALKMWNVAPGGDAETRGSISEVASHATRLAKCKSVIEMIDELEFASGSEISSKPKANRKSLKLKLSIKQTSKENRIDQPKVGKQPTSKFQIFVPKEPVFSLNAETKVAKHIQNDLSYVNETNDDEWRPSSKKQRKKPRIAPITQVNKVTENPPEILSATVLSSNETKIMNAQLNIRSRAGYSQSVATKRTTKPAAVKKKSGTLRDRLKKRLGV